MVSERNKFTRKLLLESGIKEGWRILDVGCGSGEVSLLASELINGKGEIIGIDVNAASIQIAQTRAAEENVTNVQFVDMPIENAAKELGTFDLIIGRRILMYLPNLFQAIEALTKILKSNGRMVFQESDAMVAETSATTFPLHTKAQQYVWQTVASEQGNIHIGSEMYSLFTKAGLKVKNLEAEAVLQTAETGSDLAWLLQMMEERIIQAGIATKRELESLEKALTEEMDKSNAVFIRDMNFGICVSN